jgi:hypothetical protein
LFGVLRRDHSGLGEVRFQIQDRQSKRRFRPVGVWPPLVEQEFVLLLGCEKTRNGILIPPNAFALALEYRRRLLDDREGTVDQYF